ncbi:site-2 protease family protein [Candidatus Micrarchaeota archaeon]|nr:site-2 protease family protein [Candidatus Micrarchaeota archaeon]
MKTDYVEILHIVVSVITISIAFSLFSGQFWLILITLGLGFVLHELAHKFVAQGYGAIAYYRAWTFGLVLALVLAVVTGGGFVFAAPGAVMIHGPHLTRSQNGKIAIAGAMMNFFLALGFIMLGTLTQYRELAYWGAYINAFLGAFNLIPIYPLDGQKVKAWNPLWWSVAAVILFGLLISIMFNIIPLR